MIARDGNGRCPWCGRAGRECWVMPCLSLDTALRREDERAIETFAKSVRVRLQHRKTGRVLG